MTDATNAGAASAEGGARIGSDLPAPAPAQALRTVPDVPGVRSGDVAAGRHRERRFGMAGGDLAPAIRRSRLEQVRRALRRRRARLRWGASGETG